MAFKIVRYKDKNGEIKRTHNHFTMGKQGYNPKTARLYNRGKK